MLHTITFNINGIRSAKKKGLEEWLASEKPDLIGFQELKADHDTTAKELEAFKDLGYHAFWHSAQKKGYSGVGVLARQQPDDVVIGCGMPEYDREGRVIRLDYPDYSFLNVYLPSGSSSDERQAFKEEFMDFFLPYVQGVLKERPKLIITGDFNICHREIDIHNPKRLQNTSGFLPQEREWIGRFMEENQLVDSFRAVNTEPDNYTWWSFRANSREKNLGWRIDYQFVSQPLAKNIKQHTLHTGVYQSDHIPTSLHLAL